MEDTDPQAEDVSDGISIISDCESTGRLSPHPFLRDHLNDLNFGHPDLPPLPSMAPLMASTMRRRRHHEELERDDTDATVAAATVARSQVSTGTGNEVVSIVGCRLPPLLHTGLTAVFYVGVTLALLAFVGRLRNPEWQAMLGGGGGDKQLVELEQRLVELELQNNLMRAEIDIMSKQLNYLNALAGQGQGQAQAQAQAQAQSTGGGGKDKQKEKGKGNTFKAWPGNGNTVQPVDITKEDLKRPYKCPDGKFVEIAAMCMESKLKGGGPLHAESLVDEIGNVVIDVLQQSPAFQSFEKVTERLGTHTPDQPQAIHAHGSSSENRATRRGGDTPTSNSEEGRGASDGPVPVSVPYPPKYKSSSKERYQQKKDKSYERDSKEHHHAARKYHADKSKESKERLHHSASAHIKRQRDKAEENDSGSGEWHGRLMQHREQARQRHEQKRNHNWYIERGSSREQKRSGSDESRR